MALRTVILLLTVLGAVLSLHFVAADELDSTNVTIHDDSFSHDDVVVVDGESLDAFDEVDAAEFAPDADVGEVELEDDEEEDADAVVDAADAEPDVEGHDEEALSPAHPLARILTSRSSKHCWSTKSCKKFYKKPGCCKKKCVNLASNSKNCGKCGKCCNTRKGYRCTSGKCRKPKPVKKGSTASCGKNKRCANGYTCCKGRCAKLGSNNKNCGKCGRSCKQGYSCKSGKCQKSSKAKTAVQCGKNKKCVNGYTCCKGKCVNLKNNPGHCGKCDKGCDTKNGFRCKSGQCVKPTAPSPPTAFECGDYKKCMNGQSCCKGKCVSFSSDNQNCGMCHKHCETTKGYSCKSGKCLKKPTSSQCGYTKCKPGQTCCQEKCVSLSSDNQNCGMCHKHCETTKGYGCKSGKCLKMPTSSQCGNTKCRPGQTCCHGKCVSLSSDRRNCGQCGKACDGKKGYCCKSGKCVKVTPTPSECGKDKKCGSGETCCKGKCVNVKSNNGHCGKCNKGCGYGSACCNGTCKNVKHDDRNCGKCGKSCGYAKKCCHGYCIDVFGSDNHHCGACGKKCPTTCKFGMCGYGQ